jgi:hypothetical protein
MRTNVAIELDDEARIRVFQALNCSDKQVKVTRAMLKHAVHAFVADLSTPDAYRLVITKETDTPTLPKQGEAPQSEVPSKQEAAFIPADMPLKPETVPEAGIHGLRRVLLHVNNAMFAMSSAVQVARSINGVHVDDIEGVTNEVDCLRERLVKAHDSM